MVKQINRVKKIARAGFIAAIIAGVLLVANSREEDKTEGWKIYRNERQEFELKYPAKLIRICEEVRTSDESERLMLQHSIPFEHRDPCDFDDNPDPPLRHLTDFKVGFEVVNKNLKETITWGEIGLVTEIPYGTELQIGALRGYRITTGVEGCGLDKYYFPLDSTHTLFVERYKITELDPIIINYKENRKLPDVIVPEKEEELFNNILATFKFRK